MAAANQTVAHFALLLWRLRRSLETMHSTTHGSLILMLFSGLADLY